MPAKGADLLDRLKRAKQGDEEIRNKLIADYTPFVLKVVSSTCGRYVQPGEDDEVNIALIAFNDAISSYNENRNYPFLSYSEILIKRRLIDYYRKKQRENRLIHFCNLENSEQSNEIEFNFAQRQAIISYQEQEEASERRAEIVQFTKVLAEYGISFQDLVRLSPRHQDARQRAIAVGCLVAQESQYRDYLIEKKELPLKKIEQRVPMGRRTLERQRKYIIAVSLILIYNFTYLAEYIDSSPLEV